MVCKIFEKLVNNRIVDHLQNCGLFPDFLYDRSTTDLLILASDRIARAFNRSVTTWALALDISKAFDRVCHASLLHKLTSYGIPGQIFGLTPSFLSNGRLRVVLYEKSYPVYIQLMLEFLKAPFLVVHFSYHTLMIFLMMLSVIFLFMLMILLSKCDQASDPWQQLWIGFWTWIYESDLQDTVNWVRSGLLISMLGKRSWFRLTGLITIVLLMWKWMGLFLRKNHLLRCWGWPSLLNWIGVLTLSLLLKLPPRKLEP